MTLRDPSPRLPFVATLCLLAVAGCGGGGDDGPAPTEIAALSGGGTASVPDTTPPGGTTPPGETTPPDMMMPTSAAMLDGNWLRGCGESEPGDPDEGYDVLMLTIAGTTASQRELSYVDSACTTPDSPAEFSGTLSFVFPGGTTQTALGAAMHVDRTIETILVDGMPPNDLLQVALETGGAFDPVPDLVLVTGSELYFGDVDEDTPDVRPDQLDPRPYLRQ